MKQLKQEVENRAGHAGNFVKDRASAQAKAIEGEFKQRRNADGTNDVNQQIQSDLKQTKEQVVDLTKHVLEQIDTRILRLERRSTEYIEDTTRQVQKLIMEFADMHKDLKRGLRDLRNWFEEKFGGTAMKHGLRVVTGALAAYAAAHGLRALYLRLISLRSNPLNNIKSRLWRLPEQQKTKKLGEWVNMYEDQPSPATFDRKRNIMHTPIDVLNNWGNDAKDEARRTEFLFHQSEAIHKDMESDRNLASEILQRVKNAIRKLAQLKELETRAALSAPVQRWCALDIPANIEDTSMPDFSPDIKNKINPKPGKMMFCKAFENVSGSQSVRDMVVQGIQNEVEANLPSFSEVENVATAHSAFRRPAGLREFFL